MKEKIGEVIGLISLRGAWPWLIFALGLGLYLSFQVSLVSELFRNRALPVEPDDAYAYIVKSPQLVKCPSQDCQALRDLRSQFTPHPDDPWPLAYQKWARHVRLYTQYHPLYSLGLWAQVKMEGISYEDAYRQLNVLGSLGLTVALSFFLVSLVGPLAAGISLAFLAPLVLRSQEIAIQGLFNVVPSTLSMGMGLLMFAYLARRGGRPGPTFYFLNLLAMGLHPIGFIYTGLAVAFGMACLYPWDQLRSLKGFAPSLVVMVSYYGLIQLVPPFTMLPVPIPPGFSYAKEILRNFRTLASFVSVFLLETGWPRGLFFLSKAPWWLVVAVQALGFCLGIVSLRLREGYGRNAAFLAAVLLLAPTILTLGAAALVLLVLFRGLVDSEPGRLRLSLLALSVLSVGMVTACLYVLDPAGPDNILHRVYVLWALGAAAVFGRGLMLMATAPGLGQVLPRYIRTSLVKRIPSQPWFWRALLLVFVIFCLLPRQIKDYRLRSDIMQCFIHRYDTSLDVSQPRQVLRQTSPGDVILYDRDDMEFVLPFFLTHGCLARRAVYLPYLPLPPELAIDPARVKILVGTNPFLGLSQPQKDYAQLVTLKNYLPLPPGATLTLQLDSDLQPEAVEILNLPGKLASPGQHLFLTRQFNGQTWTREHSLPPDAWTECPLPQHKGGSLSLSNPDKERTVALAGLRFKPGNNLTWRWPWRGVTEVTWQHSSPSQSRSFSPPREISFQGRTYRMTVLEDGGASIVWELKLMPSDY